jgi:hypothetical protein
MRSSRIIATIGPVFALVCLVGPAQGQSETSRSVSGGGISVPGWMGQVDANEARRGRTLEDAKLSMDGDAMHVTTGPAVSYWSSANTASGDYTVSATFREPKYMNLNSHPHPYGIFIGGSELGTESRKFLYCAAYGNGSFIVRGFGPDAFQVNGRRGGSNDAVHKAAGEGEPVTQEIALSVRGDKVECAINGTVVGSYPMSDVVAEGRLSTTDGVYGIRFGHNTEALVTGLKLTR